MRAILEGRYPLNADNYVSLFRGRQEWYQRVYPMEISRTPALDFYGYSTDTEPTTVGAGIEFCTDTHSN